MPLKNPNHVDADPSAGVGRMQAERLDVEDFFDIPNALFRFEDPVSTGATCSFDIRWLPPVTDRSAVTGPPGSTGQLVQCFAHMQWSARNDLGFSYRSLHDPTTSVFAQLGTVRNGIFA